MNQIFFLMWKSRDFTPRGHRGRYDVKGLRKKGAGRAKVPVEKKNEKNLRILPNFEILDMDSIMLVIGLVEMLNFLKKMAI